MRRKFVTSKSKSTTTTYGVYDPKAGEEPLQSEKTVRVSPSTRQVQTTKQGGIFGGLKRRSKKPTGTENAEAFLASQQK
jgi:hypothetical protein